MQRNSFPLIFFFSPKSAVRNGKPLDQLAIAFPSCLHVFSRRLLHIDFLSATTCRRDRQIISSFDGPRSPFKDERETNRNESSTSSRFNNKGPKVNRSAGFCAAPPPVCSWQSSLGKSLGGSAGRAPAVGIPLMRALRSITLEQQKVVLCTSLVITSHVCTAALLLILFQIPSSSFMNKSDKSSFINFFQYEIALQQSFELLLLGIKTFLSLFFY